MPARADAAARAEHQLLQALRRRAASRRRPSPGASDNRTCSLRVVGHGPSLRFENRVGGADLNPYLALSAIIAAGLHGVDAGLELEPAFEGNAYARPRARRACPSTLRDARELFAAQRGRARGVRRGGRRPLPQRRRRRARRRSARRSPTGSASGGSSGCERRERGNHGGSAERRRTPARSPPEARVRARALPDGLRGDRRPARHRDQARAAAAGLAAAGRARAVRAAGDRPLDAAPGADRADAERPRVRHARARRRHVRVRPAAAGRAAVDARCWREWRETCDQRLAVELGVAVLAAERAQPAGARRARRGRGDARGRARGLRRLPPGRHPPARRARRGRPARRGSCAR